MRDLICRFDSFTSVYCEVKYTALATLYYDGCEVCKAQIFRPKRARMSPSYGAIDAARHAGARRPRNGLATPAALSIVKLLGLPLIQLPLSYAAPLLSRSAVIAFEDDEAPKSPSDPNLWVYLGIAVVLVLLGGVFAGLTIALMGQDEIYLQVIATSGEGSEKKAAARVLRLLKQGKHWVLVTLLLSNVITNETLPIVLDRSLGGGWPAVLSSTILIGMLHVSLPPFIVSCVLLTILQQSSSVRSRLSPSVCVTVCPLELSCRPLSSR